NRGTEELLGPLGAPFGHGVLLVERLPIIRRPAGFAAEQDLLRIDLGPQRLARCAAQRIVELRQGGELDLAPALPIGACLTKNAAGEVVAVPAGLDDHDQPTGAQAGAGRGLPPVPLLLPVRGA